MRNNSFDCLNISQQAEILLEEGFYLHTREKPVFFVDLYELHGQFVEIYFHKKQENFMVIKSFCSNHDLETETLERADFLNSLSVNWSGIAC